MEIALREVRDADLPHFFEHQRDPEANRMAGFVSRDPEDRSAFLDHWAKIRTDRSVFIRTIEADGLVAGSVLSYERDGVPEVSYWLGRKFWGRGLATAALHLFLGTFRARPLMARVAADNTASLRVLEKSGFTVVDRDRGFAAARDCEIDEFVLKLG